MLLSAGLYGFRFLHYKGLMKQDKGFYGKLNTVFYHNNRFNTLFLGSSRAEMHYDIRFIDSKTGWDSYNVSMAGATPGMAFSVLKIYLSRSSSPDRIFYEVDLHSMKEEYSEIFDFNNYFPLLSDPFIRKEFAAIDPRMKHFYWNPFYSLPYTGLKNISTGLHAWLNLPTQSDALYYKGFMKDTVNQYGYQKNQKSEYVSLSQHHRNYLDSLIELCNKNKIRLFLISSPYFAGGQLIMANKKQMAAQIQGLAKQHNISYWDLSSLDFCNKRELFRDQTHLNAKGAEVFSQHFVDYFHTKSSGFALN